VPRNNNQGVGIYGAKADDANLTVSMADHVFEISAKTKHIAALARTLNKEVCYAISR